MSVSLADPDPIGYRWVDGCLIAERITPLNVARAIKRIRDENQAWNDYNADQKKAA